MVLLLTFVWWTQRLSAQDTIPLNSVHSFIATYKPDYTYSWWYTNSDGIKTDFISTTNKTEEVLWNTSGEFDLFVQAKDVNNCLSEIISQKFVVYKRTEPVPFVVSAGADTIIGNCQSYIFSQVHPTEDNYTYLWEPGLYISNPNIPNPVFTPGVTTTYVLLVTSLAGVTVRDTVTITVSNVIADAGEDVLMLPNSTSILDGSASEGKNISYLWTTITGKIESAANTANPVVSGFGDYYLEVTDEFGCSDFDTVNVTMLAQAPVAVDDYDTTSYIREVKIPVLANDTDEQNSIDPLTLAITLPPFNGNAYVDFNDYTIHYKPNVNFDGTDNFEYQICNTYGNCSRANVYVFVTAFNFLIPNAFSPNGDGINDYFEILGIDYYPNNKLTIINRWGNKVYEAKQYGIETSPKFWDGKSNTGFKVGDEELPTGVYYYILELGDNEKPISGSIYLDR